VRVSAIKMAAKLRTATVTNITVLTGMCSQKLGHLRASANAQKKPRNWDRLPHVQKMMGGRRTTCDGGHSFRGEKRAR